MKGHENNRNAPHALGEFSSKDKFGKKSFILMLDALKGNLRRATAYSDILFLANLKETELETVRGVKAYPEDVDLKLTDELLQFYLYVRQSQKLIEEHSFFVFHGDLYRIMCKEDIHTAFPNVKAIFRLFLKLLATNCSGERS